MKFATRYSMGFCAWIISISLFYPLVCIYGWFLFPHIYPLIILFWIGWLFNRRKTVYRFLGVKTLSAIFMLYLIISYLFIGRYDQSERTVAFHLIEMTTLIIFLSFSFQKKELRSILIAYELAGDAIILKMLIQRTLADSHRYSILNFGHIYDPNFLGASFIAPALLAFYRCQKKGFAIENIFRLAFLLGGILATGSRGTMLAFLVGAFILACGTYRLSWKTVLRMLPFFVAVGCIYFLLPSFIRERFSATSLNDGSNRLRLLLWKVAWRVFLLNPIWGNGSRCLYTLAPALGGVPGGMAHNMALEILTDYGLFGFFLLNAHLHMVPERSMI